MMGLRSSRFGLGLLGRGCVVFLLGDRRIQRRHLRGRDKPLAQFALKRIHERFCFFAQIVGPSIANQEVIDQDVAAARDLQSGFE